MHEHLPLTRNLTGLVQLLRSILFIGLRLSVVLERSCHQPSLFVHEHLVYTLLESFSSVVEARVIDQIGASVVGGDDAVMSLGTFAHRHESPFVIAAHELLSARVAVETVVHVVARVDGRSVLAVDIWAVGFLRAEHAHLVAAVGRQESIGDEEVVVLADVLDVGTFARDVVASGKLLAEVGVTGDAVAVAVRRGIDDIVVTQTRLLVEVEHPDAS